jgi:hypothetical protein
LDKKLTNQNSIGLLKLVHDVTLEGLTHIMLDHLWEMKHDAFAKGVPSLVLCGRFGMIDSIDIFARSASHLGLYDLLPWLSGFVREEISIELNFFDPSVVTGSFAASMVFIAFS